MKLILVVLLLALCTTACVPSMKDFTFKDCVLLPTGGQCTVIWGPGVPPPVPVAPTEPVPVEPTP